MSEENLENIVLKGLYTWKKFINEAKTISERAEYQKKFRHLYNYAESYGYEIPEDLKILYKAINGNDRQHSV